VDQSGAIISHLGHPRHVSDMPNDNFLSSNILNSDLAFASYGGAR